MGELELCCSGLDMKQLRTAKGSLEEGVFDSK